MNRGGENRGRGSEDDCLLVHLQKEQRYGEKEKRNQRHNLTVLSRLPVARSGAVG